MSSPKAIAFSEILKGRVRERERTSISSAKTSIAAGADVRVLRALVTKSDLAPHFDNVFLLETGGLVVAFLADPRVKDNLDDPANIAEVNEKETSVIAESIHPAHEENHSFPRQTGVRSPQ